MFAATPNGPRSDYAVKRFGPIEGTFDTWTPDPVEGESVNDRRVRTTSLAIFDTTDNILFNGIAPALKDGQELLLVKRGSQFLLLQHLTPSPVQAPGSLILLSNVSFTPGIIGAAPNVSGIKLIYDMAAGLWRTLMPFPLFVPF